MKEYKVIWDIEAKKSLKTIVEYIKMDSPSAAQKVKVVLLRIAGSLQT